MDSDDDICTPPDILELATKLTHNLLAEKCRKLYEKEYNNFLAWKIEKKTTSFSENVILAYLKDLSDKFKPFSMWAKYSMLKSTLSIYNNIDITKYSKVIAFLKRSSEGHKEKKSLTFTSGQIKMFLEDSPDILYLFEKDYVIFKHNVKKVVLVGPDTAMSIGTALLASGWGSSNVDLEYNNKLIRTEMIVMDKDECLNWYDTVRVTPAMFCGKYASNHRLSDNGGPVVFDNILVGITSFGADNERSPFIAILTNVSYFYRWIEINTEFFLNKYCVQESSKKITDANEYQ